MTLKSLSSDGFYGWTNVTVASIFMFTITLMLYTSSLFQLEWVKEFNWKYRDISIAVNINLIVMSFITPIVGFFIGKYGSRIAIIIGSSIVIIAIYFLANIHSLLHLYLVNGVIVAIGISLGGVLAITTLINNWFSKKRSLSLSISMMAMGAAGMIVVPVVTWMIVHTGWRSTYMTFIPIYFIFALLLPGIFLKNTPQELGQVPDGPDISKSNENTDEIPKDMNISSVYRTTVDFTVSEAFKTRAIWLLMIFNILNWFNVMGVMQHGYTFLNDIGIPRTHAGLFMGMVSGTMILAQAAVGFLGLKYDMHKLALIGCIGIIISYILMVYAASSNAIVYTYAIFMGIGAGINQVALMNIIPNYFGVTHFSKISGITTPVGTFLGSYGVSVCGHIRDVTGSYILFWKIAAILMTLGFLCLYFAKPPKHPSLKESRDTGYSILDT